MPRSNGTLTPKQLAFCREYVIDHNGAAAAVRGGFSERCARQEASKLLKNPRIMAEIALIEEKLAERCAVTVETISQQLQDDRQLAHKVGQPGAAVAASMGLAKLHGLIVDKSLQTSVQMTHEEWLRQMDADGTGTAP